jgi:hypothetical protein
VVGPNQDQTIQFLAFSLCFNFAPKFQLIASDLAHRHTQFNFVFKFSNSHPKRQNEKKSLLMILMIDGHCGDEDGQYSSGAFDDCCCYCYC